MQPASLHELAAQFCAIAGTDTPPIAAGDDGIHVFSATVSDVHVVFSHDPVARPDDLAIDVYFGAVPLEEEARVLRGLLYANREFSRHAHGPAFSCDPKSSQVILHYLRTMAGATGDGLWTGVQDCVDTVLQWRGTFFLAAPADPFADHPPGALALLA